MSLLVILLVVVNFGISWLNAWSCGRSWADSKAIGGWPRVVVWSAAIMSACGFTWCYLIVAAIALGAAGSLPPDYVRGALELGYVIIILPVLGSGLAIWIDSVTTAWRERSFGNVAVAGWNTFAQAHNMYEAANTLPGVFSHLGELFEGGDDDDAKARLGLAMILLVLATCVLGILTTTWIIRSTAREYASGVLVNKRERAYA